MQPALTQILTYHFRCAHSSLACVLETSAGIFSELTCIQLCKKTQPQTKCFPMVKLQAQLEAFHTKPKPGHTPDMHLGHPPGCPSVCWAPTLLTLGSPGTDTLENWTTGSCAGNLKINLLLWYYTTLWPLNGSHWANANSLRLCRLVLNFLMGWLCTGSLHTRSAANLVWLAVRHPPTASTKLTWKHKAAWTLHHSSWIIWQKCEGAVPLDSDQIYFIRW